MFIFYCIYMHFIPLSLDEIFPVADKSKLFLLKWESSTPPQQQQQQQTLHTHYLWNYSSTIETSFFWICSCVVVVFFFFVHSTQIINIFVYIYLSIECLDYFSLLLLCLNMHMQRIAIRKSRIHGKCECCCLKLRAGSSKIACSFSVLCCVSTIICRVFAATCVTRLTQ